MRISMWMLYDELSDYDKVACIQSGERAIEGVRLLSDDYEYSYDYVYLVNWSYFFSDAGDSTVLLAHGNDYILLRNVVVLDVINAVMRIFEKYRRWNERLDIAMRGSEPFQNVLSVAHDILKCPMYLGQKNMRIIAISEQYNSETAFDEWDDMKRFRAIPARLIERLRGYNLADKYPEDIDPTIFPTEEGSLESVNYNYTLRKACYFNGEIWGHFFAFYGGDEVSPSVIQLIIFIVERFQDLLKDMPEVRSGYQYCEDLVKLLNGEELAQEGASKLYYKFGWDEFTDLYTYKITPSNCEFDRMLFHSVCTSISDTMTDAVVFPYGNEIIIVAAKDSARAETIEQDLMPFLKLGSFICGRSMSFSGIENLPTYCKQADIAISLNRLSHNEVHLFEDYAYSGVSKVFSDLLNWREWVHPSLFKLRDSDLTQGTEYFKTLYYFLKNQGHYGNTCKELFIHRNTLTYRLGRIEDMLNIDIHSENISSYLRFCYELAIVNDMSFPDGVQNLKSDEGQIEN